MDRIDRCALPHGDRRDQPPDGRADRALTFLCVLYTIKIVPKPQEKFKGLFALMLLLETGMLGTFTSLDLILWFVFWEMVLVPMYFIISIWGSERKEYSAIKFFLYTFFGSVFMLLAFLALYFRSDIGGGVHTFDMLQLAEQGSVGGFGTEIPELRVPRAVPRVRDQGADVAVPHLASRRARRCAHRGLGPAGGRPAEDGHVRVHPDRVADLAGGRAHTGRPGSAGSRRRDHVRRAVLPSRRRTSSASIAFSRSGTWVSSCSASPR